MRYIKVSLSPRRLSIAMETPNSSELPVDGTLPVLAASFNQHNSLGLCHFLCTLPVPTGSLSPQDSFNLYEISQLTFVHMGSPGLTQCPVLTLDLVPVDPLTSSSLTTEAAAPLLVSTYHQLTRYSLHATSLLSSSHRLTYDPLPRPQHTHSPPAPYRQTQ